MSLKYLKQFNKMLGIKTTLTLLAFSFSLLAFSQTIIIKGKAPKFRDKKAQLYEYTDYISELKEPITDKKLIASEGTFEFSIKKTKATYIVLKIQKYKAEFYVQPNHNYTIHVFDKDSANIETFNNEIMLKYAVECTDSSDINKLAIKYNRFADSFYSNYYVLILKKNAKHQCDSFVKASTNFFKKYKNTYFDDYVKYNNAALEVECYKSNRFIFVNYWNHTVDYDNKDYMDFFNEFFNRYVDKLSGMPKGNRIEAEINDNKSFSGLCQQIKIADTLLKNDTLIELLALKGLKEAYYIKGYSKKSVIQCLGNAQSQIKTKAFAFIADDIVKKISIAAPGAKVPDFKLYDEDEKIVSLTDYKGKNLYLAFGATWNESFLQDLKLLNKMNEKYYKKTHFVVIVVDDFEKAEKIKKDNKYDITLLDGTINNTELIDFFDVRAVPAYYWISSDGYFIQSPAESPTERIEKIIFDANQPK